MISCRATISPYEAPTSPTPSRQHRMGALRQRRPQGVQRPGGSDPEGAGKDGNGAGEEEAGEEADFMNDADSGLSRRYNRSPDWLELSS